MLQPLFEMKNIILLPLAAFLVSGVFAAEPASPENPDNNAAANNGAANGTVTGFAAKTKLDGLSPSEVEKNAKIVTLEQIKASGGLTKKNVDELKKEENKDSRNHWCFGFMKMSTLEGKSDEFKQELDKKCQGIQGSKGDIFSVGIISAVAVVAASFLF